MSLQEQACQLIYDLPEEKLETVIHILISMKPSIPESLTEKQKAYRNLMVLRDTFTESGVQVSDSVRSVTLDEKYGVIV